MKLRGEMFRPQTAKKSIKSTNNCLRTHISHGCASMTATGRRNETFSVLCASFAFRLQRHIQFHFIFASEFSSMTKNARMKDTRWKSMPRELNQCAKRIFERKKLLSDNKI